MPTKKTAKVEVSKKINKCVCNPKTLTGIMYLVILLIIIFSATKLWLITQKFNSTINKETYQVVSLDNGESYFGQLENIGFKYYKLSDVYYIKYSTIEAEAENTPSYELKINKLGAEEFYKPENTMIINKENIVHWENLQPDSDVMEYIKENK